MIAWRYAVCGVSFHAYDRSDAVARRGDVQEHAAYRRSLGRFALGRTLGLAHSLCAANDSARVAGAASALRVGPGVHGSASRLAAFRLAGTPYRRYDRLAICRLRVAVWCKLADLVCHESGGRPDRLSLDRS